MTLSALATQVKVLGRRFFGRSVSTPAAPDEATDRGLERVVVPGLVQKEIDARADAFGHDVRSGIGGQEDPADPRPALADLGQELRSALARHPLVGDDDLDGMPTKGSKRGGGV